MATRHETTAGTERIDPEESAYISPVVDFLFLLAIALQFAVAGAAIIVL